jgi:hypothetical protein
MKNVVDTNEPMKKHVLFSSPHLELTWSWTVTDWDFFLIMIGWPLLWLIGWSLR